MTKTLLISLFLMLAVSVGFAESPPEANPVCASAAGTEYKSTYLTVLLQYGDLFMASCKPVVFTECVNTKCDDAHPENCISGNPFATEQYVLKGGFICCDNAFKGSGSAFTTEAEFIDGKFNGQQTDLDLSDSADKAVSAACQ